ncbi:glycine receptor subunit alpha-2-like isoform X1 [Hetaerina americana]|uniref:glycine receptor subunit alpha-2-like isoform X1 n=1 Tax=Hetaerina americana TaxID=62018 RepID=UPI003A7F20A0
MGWILVMSKRVLLLGLYLSSISWPNFAYAEACHTSSLSAVPRTHEDAITQSAIHSAVASSIATSALSPARHPRRRASMRKRPSHAARRYQPRLSLCAGQCLTSPSAAAAVVDPANNQSDLYYRNLLLLGNLVTSNSRDRFRKCAISKRLNGTDAGSLESVLETEILYSRGPIVQIVVNIVVQDWSHGDPEHMAQHAIKVVDKMVEQLGNVSVFVSSRSESSPTHGTLPGIRNFRNTVLEYCHKRRKLCSGLDNLYMVLEQMQRMQNNPSLLDVYNTKFVKLQEDGSTAVFAMPTISPLIKSLPVHKQLDHLLTMFCERERSKNRFIEIHFVEPPKKKEASTADFLEPGMVPETSLSLRDILPINPKNYDKNRAPKLAGQPTIVYFHVTVLSIDSINEESMTYVADIFLAQSWRDPRLRLPENMREEYRILDVGWLQDIWRPDCFFKNAKKVTFHEMSIPNHYLWLYHDKTLLYMSKLTLVLSCAMKFESYPHDTQICSMMIESLSHTVHDLVFIWNMTDPLVVNPEIELPQLDISKNYTADCTIEYSTGNFTCLAVVFNLTRRLGYHLFHTYIPSALIVVMSWISFWIKPEAIPARVTLGVTSLLTLDVLFVAATQNTQSQQSLPPVSYVKAIDVWMSSCSVFVFLSLMEFAVVNNYMGPVATKVMKGYSDDDIRSAVEDFKELEPRSWAGRNRAATLAGSPVRPTPTQPQYDTFCHGRETALYIDKVSRFFFPFSFFILNVVYWSTFL